MSFLRISRGIVRGKRFATRRKAAEYLYRVNGGTLKCADGGGKLGLAYLPEFDTPEPLVEPKPREFQPAKGGVCRRVYPLYTLNGEAIILWRLTVENIWKSDHVSMEDALRGVNPIGVEPEAVKPGVVFVPQ